MWLNIAEGPVSSANSCTWSGKEANDAGEPCESRERWARRYAECGEGEGWSAGCLAPRGGVPYSMDWSGDCEGMSAE